MKKEKEMRNIKKRKKMWIFYMGGGIEYLMNKCQKRGKLKYKIIIIN